MGWNETRTQAPADAYIENGARVMEEKEIKDTHSMIRAKDAERREKFYS
jgi:hypothetical protein